MNTIQPIDVAAVERPTGWTGSLEQLREKLSERVPRDDRPKDWPGTGKALANALRRLTPALMTIYGVEILHDNSSHKARTWTVRIAPGSRGASGADGGGSN